MRSSRFWPRTRQLPLPLCSLCKQQQQVGMAKAYQYLLHVLGFFAFLLRHSAGNLADQVVLVFCHEVHFVNARRACQTPKLQDYTSANGICEPPWTGRLHYGHEQQYTALDQPVYHSWPCSLLCNTLCWLWSIQSLLSSKGIQHNS